MHGCNNVGVAICTGASGGMHVDASGLAVASGASGRIAKMEDRIRALAPRLPAA